MGRYDGVDPSKMDPATRKMFERGEAMAEVGENLHKAGESLTDAGRAMTLGCTVPILIFGGLFLLLALIIF